MKKNLLILSLFLLGTTLKGQEYIVFEKQKGMNNKTILPLLSLAQNDVMLKAGDTTLNIFNLFYTASSGFKWGSLSSSLQKYDIATGSAINNILIVAVPVIKPGEQLTLEKISIAHLNALKIATDKALIEESLPPIYVHLTEERYRMPSLKTFEYGLIIKEGDSYFKVKQKVLVTRYTAGYRPIYFPNEFKSALLNYNARYMPNSFQTFLKTYRLPELELILKQVEGTRIADKIYNRIYLSRVDPIANLNQYLFTFWEFQDEEVKMAFANPIKLAQFHPGLGSFSFLHRVGIINCTLDFYLKNTILFDQTPTFSIVSINSMEFEKFKENYRNFR